MARTDLEDQVLARPHCDPVTTGFLDWLRADTATAIQHWTGSPGALRAEAAALLVEPSTGSPLADVVADGRTLSRGTPPRGLDDAIRVLARPEIVLDLDHVPPGVSASVRLYARTDTAGMVCHWDGDDRHDVWWPLAPESLARFACGLVDSAQPVIPLGVTFKGDRAVFEAVAALVDIVQEEALVALLEGRAAPDLAVDTRDIVAVFHRPRSDDDLRWMVARARRLAPIPLAPSEATIERALAQLANDGWLVRLGDRYGLSDLLRLACAVLADTRGWWALARRTRFERGDRPAAWRREHAAVLRSLSALWSLHVDAVSIDDFTFEFRDATVDAITTLTQLLFDLPRQVHQASPSGPEWRDRPEGASRRPDRDAPANDDTPRHTTDERPTCPACGRQVRQGVTFCTQCGLRLG